jgi:uncharacterized protein YcnI
MRSCLTAFGITIALTAPASAHVTLQGREAQIGAPYTAVFRVPHGCNGSATIRLSVQIPEGVVAVKPKAKAEWKIDVKRGAYAKPYSFTHGAKFTEGTKEITWTGKLPDAYYDDFVISTFISGDLPAGSMLYFPAVQECEQGIHRWVDVPSGKPGEKLGEPAPGVKLIPHTEAH